MNSAFGANVPHLIELILKELDVERRIRDTDPQTSGRIYYELEELTPIERERFEAEQKIEEQIERIEQESEQRRRFEYMKFVTDSIMKNSNDMGVTVLMPHVISRDLLKRLSDPAEKCQLVAKDKKTVQILREHIDTLEICAVDAIPTYLVDHILNWEIFVVCWKVTDTNIDINVKSVEGSYFQFIFYFIFMSQIIQTFFFLLFCYSDYLSSFVHFVWNGGGGGGVNGNGSILKALSVVIETESNDDNDEMNGVDNIEEEKSIDQGGEQDKNDGKKVNEKEGNRNGDEGEWEVNQSEIATEEQEMAQTNDKKENHTENKQTEANTSAEDTDDSEMNSKKTEEFKSSRRTTPTSPALTHRTVIKIPPIWTPSDKRVNAGLIYLYFRSVSCLELKRKRNNKSL